MGWSIFEDGRLASYGKYLQEGEGHGERLASFSEWLAETMFETDADYVVVEKPFPGRNRNAYRVLTMYIGRVLETFWRMIGVELPDDNFIAPQTVKAQLTLPKGQSHDDNKRIAVEEINRLYCLNLRYKKNDPSKKTSDDDAADAIALNRAWHLKYRPEVMADLGGHSA